MNCGHCGVQFQDDAKFCVSCGRPVAALAPSSAHAPPPAVPVNQITPDEVASTAVTATGKIETSDTPINSRKGSRNILIVVAAISVAIVAGVSIRHRASNGQIATSTDTRTIDQALAFAKQKNYVKENELLQPLAARGVARAQYNLGVSYEMGMGVAPDKTRAAEWYRKAAEQSFVPAEVAICNDYFFGVGVAKDSTKAVEWCQKAANQGNATAQYLLGEAYKWGDGVGKDNAKALAWYIKAADQSDLEAMTNAGILYVDGDGVPGDSAKGMALIRKAADLGNAKAQDALGQIYLEGMGVEKDYTQARAWFQKASDQGYEHARSALTQMAAVNNPPTFAADDLKLICKGTYTLASPSIPMMPQSMEVLGTVAANGGVRSIAVRMSGGTFQLDSNAGKGFVVNDRSDRNKIDLTKENRDKSPANWAKLHILFERDTGKLNVEHEFFKRNEVTDELLTMDCRNGTDRDAQEVVDAWKSDYMAALDDTGRYAVGLSESIRGGICDTIARNILTVGTPKQVPDYIRMQEMDTLLNTASKAGCLKKE